MIRIFLDPCAEAGLPEPRAGREATTPAPTTTLRLVNLVITFVLAQAAPGPASPCLPARQTSHARSKPLSVHSCAAPPVERAAAPRRFVVSRDANKPQAPRAPPGSSGPSLP